MTRIVALLTGLALCLVAGPAQAAPQRLTIFVTSVGAERGAVVCTPECTPAQPTVPEDVPILAGRHICVGTSLVGTATAYRCSVFVGAALAGRAVAANVPVKVTFEIISDDGSPWGDEVRRAIRAQPVIMQPPVGGAPAPCSVVPNADPRATCAKLGPGNWKVSSTTKSKTGLWILPLQIEFPSSSGTEPVCEYLRLKGTATSAGQTARVDLGRRRYCA